MVVWFYELSENIFPTGNIDFFTSSVYIKYEQKNLRYIEVHD